MPDPETPRGASPSLRLAATASPEPAALAPPLEALLETLAPAGIDRAGASQTLQQRLGDACTLALLAQGDTARGAGRLIADSLQACVESLARSLADRPDDATGRLAILRTEGGLRFGRVLIAQGLVAPRRLEAALEAQKASGRRIGEELVAEGLITAREVAEALWLQHKLVAAAHALFAAEAARIATTPRLVRSN